MWSAFGRDWEQEKLLSGGPGVWRTHQTEWAGGIDQSNGADPWLFTSVV